MPGRRRSRRLTSLGIERLRPPATGRMDQFDAQVPGLALRVSATGAKSWCLFYRVAGRQRRLTLGRWPAMPLDEARRRATDALAQAQAGNDPAELRARRKADTLGALVEAYLAHAARSQRPRTFVERHRYLVRSWAPLHDTPLSELHRRRIAMRKGELEHENGPIAANRALAALSACLNWAIASGLHEGENPAARVPKAPETSRERVLSAGELLSIWASLPESDFGAIVKLLILTGQRREEVAGMRWSELGFDDATPVWHLPVTRTKNGRAHDVPLSAQAVALLLSLPRIEGRDYIFGRGEGPFSGWSRAKARLDEASGIAEWTLHDLRRTVVTNMAELGISPHIVEAVVNHVSGHKGGVAGVYNRASYATEKRRALQAWADQVEARLRADRGNENVMVLPMRPGQRRAAIITEEGAGGSGSIPPPRGRRRERASTS